MSVAGLFVILLSGILVNNYVLSKFLGICPFLGVSKQVETSIGMSMAVTFVMTLASIITYMVHHLILVNFHLEYLQTIAFILVIAALVQFVEMVVQKVSPSLYKALGVYLPLITTNCAVLGLTLINIQENYGIVETIVNALGASIGFGLAIILFAGIRERLELSDVPAVFQGFPI
ncbi:MAG: RnfABCDGE type electron transport complex subunit A, partial [Clostridia bacterium]|nr:RnfABCDGE type electron transport complex subunit A [Clostridia bacterium]